MQLDLTEDGQNRRADRHGLRGPFAVDRLRPRIDIGLSPSGDFQDPPEEAAAARLRRQPLANHRLQHRRHLARWSRQQHQRGLVPLQPQAGRRPVGICEHRGAARHHRLPPVDLRHRHAAPGEPVTNPFDDPLVDVERHVEHPCDRVAGDVVFGRTKPARHDDEIGPGERPFQHARELVDVVGDDGLEAHVVPNCVQPVGDEQGVRVDAKRRQHLTAYRHNAGPHLVISLSGHLIIGLADRTINDHITRRPDNQRQTRSVRLA